VSITSGAGRIRTRDIFLRGEALYPAELQLHGGGTGSRTRVTRFAGECLKPLGHAAVVRSEGIEPTTPGSGGRCSIR
jgi:hypothetical protein